jgi:hypothetical protein
MTNEIDKLCEGILSSSTDLFKCQFEFNKHMATLCSGSIIIIAAFVEKTIENLAGKILVLLSLGGFVVSLLAAVLMMKILGDYYAILMEVRTIFLEVEASKAEEKTRILEGKRTKLIKMLDTQNEKIRRYQPFRNYAFILGMVMLIAFVAVTVFFPTAPPPRW